MPPGATRQRFEPREMRSDIAGTCRHRYDLPSRLAARRSAESHAVTLDVSTPPIPQMQPATLPVGLTGATGPPGSESAIFTEQGGVPPYCFALVSPADAVELSDNGVPQRLIVGRTDSNAPIGTIDAAVLGRRYALDVTWIDHIGTASAAKGCEPMLDAPLRCMSSSSIAPATETTCPEYQLEMKG
jgi:hypothetical protein